MLLQVTLQSDEMRAHGTVFAILERVLVVVEDLGVGLSDVLSKHGDNFIASLMVESEQVNAEFVVDVL